MPQLGCTAGPYMTAIIPAATSKVTSPQSHGDVRHHHGCFNGGCTTADCSPGVDCGFDTSEIMPVGRGTSPVSRT
jgi:hypothetical protein